MVSREARHSFYLICLIILLNQMPDLLPPFDGVYYAVPYLVRFMIDMSCLALFIAAVEGYTVPDYVKAIISIQAISLTIHAIMLGMNVMIRFWPYEIFAIIHDGYQPALEAAFYFKLIALLWGGYGIFNRDTSGDDLLDSDDPSSSDCLERRRPD